MALRDLARERGLDESTIETLMAEGYTTTQALLQITDADMEEMRITRGQRRLIKKWTEELEASKAAGQNEENTKTEDQQNKASGVKPKTPVDEKAGSSKLPHVDDLTLGLHDDTIKDIQRHIEEHGVQDARKVLNEKLEKYKETPVNIAVTGQSGAGKSSFINCMQNLKAGEVGAAEVGTTETTMNRQPYPDPENTNLVYWDLPGIGTVNFRRQTYLQKVCFEEYDFFLLLSESRLSEDDMYLAEEVQKRTKNFFFIRTKIDQDLDSEKNDNPTNYDPDRVVKIIRDKCNAELSIAGVSSSNTFIISSRLNNRGEFDFPKLIETIFLKAPQEKRTSVILALTACSEEGIEAKRKELEDRIHSVATGAALRESVAMTQQDFITEEIQLYAKQFGLTNTDMKNICVDVVTTRERYATDMGIPGKFIVNATQGIMNVLSAPVKLAKKVTGHLREDRDAIAKELLKVLNKCADAAKEIIRLKRSQ